jgi:hypothetical protein
MPGKYDLSGTGSSLPEPDEADLKAGETGGCLGATGIETNLHDPPDVSMALEPVRLKHEAALE